MFLVLRTFGGGRFRFLLVRKFLFGRSCSVVVCLDFRGFEGVSVFKFLLWLGGWGDF